MNNDKEKLDEMYRKRFRGYELPVSDSVLSNIKKELNLDDSKKRIGYWKWIFIFSLCLVGASGMYYLILTKEEAPIVNTNNKDMPKQLIAENKKENNRETNTIITTHISTTSKNSTQINSIDTKQEEPKIESEMPEIVLDDSKAVSENTVNPEIITYNKVIGKVSTSTADATQRVLSKEKTKFEKDFLSHMEKQKAHNEKKSSVAKNTTSKEKEKKTVDKPSASAVTKTSNENKKTTASSSMASTSLKGGSGERNVSEKIMNVTETDKNMQSAISLNPMRKLTSGENEGESTKITEVSSDNLSNPMRQLSSTENSKDTLSGNKIDSIANSQPVYKEKKISFYVELNGGPSFSNCIGGLTGITLTKPKTITTYNAGVDLGIVVKNKFGINFGFGIDNKGEQYSIESHKLGSDTNYYGHYDSISNHAVLDSAHLNNHSTVSTTTIHTSYQFLKIPIMMSYCFTIKDKVFVRPAIGVNINYLLSASSAWFDAENKIIVYSKNDNVFNNLSYSAKFKIDIGLIVKNNLFISIQPGYTRFLQSIYSSKFSNGEVPDFKPYSFDVNFGIGYKF